jgi:hypothetical protein
MVPVGGESGGLRDREEERGGSAAAWSSETDECEKDGDACSDYSFGNLDDDEFAVLLEEYGLNGDESPRRERASSVAAKTGFATVLFVFCAFFTPGRVPESRLGGGWGSDVHFSR